MDIVGSQKRHNRRLFKDRHKHSHNVCDWITRGKITNDIIDSASMKVKKISCNKNIWYISGTIWGNVEITLSNDGEYGCGLDYNSNESFIIGKSADWKNAHISLPNGQFQLTMTR